MYELELSASTSRTIEANHFVRFLAFQLLIISRIYQDFFVSFEAVVGLSLLLLFENNPPVDKPVGRGAKLMLFVLPSGLSDPLFWSVLVSLSSPSAGLSGILIISLTRGSKSIA